MDVRSALLRVIAQAARDREALDRRAASELITHAEVVQSVAAQQRTLTGARAQIRAAITAASSAADEVRAVDGPQAAELYDRTRAVLQDQLVVIESALAQLAELATTASLTAGSAHRLLRRSSDGVDAALHAAVRQLAQVERLERDRVIARLQGRDGDPQQE